MPIEQHDPQALQQRIREQGASWRAGQTSKSGLSDRQKRLHLGAEHPSLADIEIRGARERHQEQRRAGAYPAQFDWRNVNGADYITPIKDQGSCGSCVAFGTAASIEGRFQVQRNNPSSGIDLSEAQLFYCYAGQDGETCETGWWPDNAFKYVQSSGVTAEQYFPYAAGDQSCALQQGYDTALTYITGVHNLNSTSDMKDWVANNGPTTTCFNVYDDFFYYTGGIYRRVSQQLAGGHCVTVIGFDDTQGYWICKNSWGTGWGEQGFFNIAYGECGIDAQMWAVDGIANTGWINNTYVLGAFAYATDSDMWVYLDQVGWAQCAASSPEVSLTMFEQLLASKAGNRPNNVHLTDGVIDQIYAL